MEGEVMRTYLNNNWEFTRKFTDDCLRMDYLYEEQIRLPHTVALMPYHYGNEGLYQMLSGYRRHLFVPNADMGKSLLLTFEGAAHYAKVYINGIMVIENDCGYTGFTVAIEEYVNYGVDNIIVVALDSRETLNQPPFGHVVDYMTYGGIYRDVYLDVKQEIYMENLYLKPYPDLDHLVNKEKNQQSKMVAKSKLEYEITLHGASPQNELTIQMTFLENGRSYEIHNSIGTIETSEVYLWEPEHPNLYEVQVDLIQDGVVIDEQTITVGYRTTEFNENGFFLNGELYKIRGLNRHQAFPYIGYAAPQHLQEEDARILKEELGLNSVRTSHYPQSQYFIDECDRIGLLVFTEIPGWQHIGDDSWKAVAIENTRRMVLQYRNHPSIMLWGVRINESIDDDKFYNDTNEVAHSYDDTRQTGGVRCIRKSHLLEDVYTYNDFIYEGDNQILLPKHRVTSDSRKGYLISEYNGHMFPTKPYDTEERRREHALRHAEILNKIAQTDDIAGGFGWCAFDYNTHIDFGSGDRICYHGVCDMFRNPKLAAYVYRVEGGEAIDPVLMTSGNFEIGEYSGGQIGKNFIVTNCQEVKMYRNDIFIKTYKVQDSKYQWLQHGPIEIDDFIGNQLVDVEGFSEHKAETVKKLIHGGMMYGMSKLPAHVKQMAIRCIVRYHMNRQDIIDLYEKYIGGWGSDKTQYRFDGYINDKKVVSITRSPMTTLSMEVVLSKERLIEENSYDMIALRIRMVDENGNVAQFYNDPVEVSIQGPAKVVGPHTFGLQGGQGGCYIASMGEKGVAKITLHSSDVTHIFDIPIGVNINPIK